MFYSTETSKGKRSLGLWTRSKMVGLGKKNFVFGFWATYSYFFLDTLHSYIMSRRNNPRFASFSKNCHNVILISEVFNFWSTHAPGGITLHNALRSSSISMHFFAGGVSPPTLRVILHLINLDLPSAKSQRYAYPGCTLVAFVRHK